MSKPLTKDFTRCYGDGCPEKEHCLRFTTMRHDLPNTVYSYTLSLRRHLNEPPSPLGDGDYCESKIDGDVSDLHPL